MYLAKHLHFLQWHPQELHYTNIIAPYRINTIFHVWHWSSGLPEFMEMISSLLSPHPFSIHLEYTIIWGLSVWFPDALLILACLYIVMNLQTCCLWGNPTRSRGGYPWYKTIVCFVGYLCLVSFFLFLLVLLLPRNMEDYMYSLPHTLGIK